MICVLFCGGVKGYLFLLNFYLEIILDSQEVAKTAESSLYPSHSRIILHNCSYQNQEMTLAQYSELDNRLKAIFLL